MACPNTREEIPIQAVFIWNNSFHSFVLGG